MNISNSKNSLYENLIISYIVKYAKLYYFCDTINTDKKWKQ